MAKKKAVEPLKCTKCGERATGFMQVTDARAEPRCDKHMTPSKSG